MLQPDLTNHRYLECRTPRRLPGQPNWVDVLFGVWFDVARLLVMLRDDILVFFWLNF